jgi:hypothetical protein
MSEKNKTLHSQFLTENEVNCLRFRQLIQTAGGAAGHGLPANVLTTKAGGGHIRSLGPPKDHSERV